MLGWAFWLPRNRPKPSLKSAAWRPTDRVGRVLTAAIKGPWPAVQLDADWQFQEIDRGRETCNWGLWERETSREERKPLGVGGKCTIFLSKRALQAVRYAAMQSLDWPLLWIGLWACAIQNRTSTTGKSYDGPVTLRGRQWGRARNVPWRGDCMSQRITDQAKSSPKVHSTIITANNTSIN